MTHSGRSIKLLLADVPPGGPMREISITLCVTCLAFASAANSHEWATEADEQAIHNTYKAWVEATNEKDIEKWSTFLAASPYFHPADSQPLENTEDVLSYYVRSFADPRFSLDCKQEHVDVSELGKMAWSHGLCIATFTGADGNEESGTSRWLKVWIRQTDGSWRCRVNTWRNVDQP